MFLRITRNNTSHLSTLGDFGISSQSDAAVNLNEITYKKGTEIYGEKEPAEYVYQVKKRRRANIQIALGWPAPDWSVPPGGRYLRSC